jgi:hypothetical protein
LGFADFPCFPPFAVDVVVLSFSTRASGPFLEDVAALCRVDRRGSTSSGCWTAFLFGMTRRADWFDGKRKSQELLIKK